MAEKKIQENPLPEEQQQPESETLEKPKDIPSKMIPDKSTTIPLPVPVSPPAPRVTMPTFTKTSPNDLYRRLLPAVLFVLTFVTVMTMLLIYMDTVALGAQQFRVNMSRDYELARIPQASPALVAFVRQLHLAPRAARPPPAPPGPSPAVVELDRRLGPAYNGTFVEIQPRGPRDAGTAYLEAVRGWSGLVVRAAARDFLALRGAARALHACLSPTAHPREVTYHEADSHETAFSSRVLCLPLVTILLAAEATAADYLLLAGDAALPALRHLPMDQTLRLQIIEVRSTDLSTRNKTTQYLESRNYTVAATFNDSVMYSLNEV